jgi:hypothetical protein
MVCFGYNGAEFLLWRNRLAYLLQGEGDMQLAEP